MQLLSPDCDANALRHMTADQLLYLGSDHVVYLKAATLYSAEGKPLLTLETFEEAVELVAASDLSLAMVH